MNKFLLALIVSIAIQIFGQQYSFEKNSRPKQSSKPLVQVGELSMLKPNRPCSYKINEPGLSGCRATVEIPAKSGKLIKDTTCVSKGSRALFRDPILVRRDLAIRLKILS